MGRMLCVLLLTFSIFHFPFSIAHAGGHVKGVSLAHAMRGGGYGSDACCDQLKKIADLGGTWISVSDFGFMQSVTQPSVRHGRWRR